MLSYAPQMPPPLFLNMAEIKFQTKAFSLDLRQSSGSAAPGTGCLILHPECNL